ncbi:MAG: hypothetical protein DRG20_01370 [Deltaproteobacteria bacterium]|nr:MAG: hypothetical protein DRG20_01370 [Deltaproteobacteria bacterium]
MLAIGIDIGGSKIRMGVIDVGEGRVLKTIEWHIRKGVNPEELVEEIALKLRQLIEKPKDLKGIGIAAAGQIAIDRKEIIFSPNLAWHNVSLVEMLKQKTGYEVWMENDVRSAAIGEMRFGVAKGISDFIVIFVGTGIGSGIVVDGKLLRGVSNTAGEVGHTILQPGGYPCSCGNRGCFETYSGGSYLSKKLWDRIKTKRINKNKIKKIPSDINEINVSLIQDMAKDGDESAIEIWEEAKFFLGIGIANLVSIFNPEMIILGGGVIEHAPSLIEDVKIAIKRDSVPASAKMVKVVRSSLGAYATIIGVASLGGNIDI